MSEQRPSSPSAPAGSDRTHTTSTAMDSNASPKPDSPPEDLHEKRRPSSSHSVHSTTTTAVGDDHPPHQHRPRAASSVLAPPPDVVSVFDPASVGGGGPLVRIASQHSQRRLSQRRSHGAASMRRPTFTGFGDPNSPVFEEDDDGKLPSMEIKKVEVEGEGQLQVLEKGGAPGSEEDCEKCRDAEEEEEAHAYPDGGYGWVVVACCTTLCALTNGWGMNFGVFQQYYVEEVYPTAPTAVVSLAGTTQGFFFACVAFISGRLGDRFGFKRVLYFAAFMCWLGTFCAGFANPLWALILTQGVITGIGSGIAAPLFMSLPSQWFLRRRGLASGITMGGAGLGGGISSLIIRKLLLSVGRHKTLIIMSFINLSAMLVSIFLIRTRPTAPEARAARGPLFNGAVFRLSEFWSIALSLLIAIIGYSTPYTFLASWVAERFPNLTGMAATGPVSVLAFSVCIGRALVGFCADYVGPLNTYISVFILSGVIQLALWLTATNLAGTYAFAVLYGLIAPGFLGLLPQIVVTVLGPTALASNLGILLMFNAPGNLVGGPMGGGIRDATGSYKWTIASGGILQIVGGIIATWARFRTSSKLFSQI